MALPENLSPENIVGTAIAGIIIAIIIVRQYLKERQTPTSHTGDRIIPGVTIADMEPVRSLAKEQGRTATATERIANAAEGLLQLLTDQAKDDEIEEEVERRLRQRQADRRQRTTRT